MDERTLRARMLLGGQAMEKLKNSHVAVFGLGGVGSWCAEALVRSGIGKITVIDRDTVGRSNINRQVIATESTVGLPKAQVIKARLLEINPQAEVVALCGHYDAEHREDFFGDYDYIVDAIDLVSCKIDLIMTAIDRGIPIVSSLGTGNKKDASQLMLCDIKKTSGCPLARVVRKELRARGIEHLDVVFSPEEAAECEQPEAPPPGRRSVPGSLVWVTATAGMLLCQHVILKLTEAE
ncbi:MAG: tRNA threonylcarbamoyladenosine dehydratase [Bacillota bacterium]|nr:tRNA threonylcarbamoyladenosine dehydratase [Bacillota bacterium]